VVLTEIFFLSKGFICAVSEVAVFLVATVVSTKNIGNFIGIDGVTIATGCIASRNAVERVIEEFSRNW